MAKRIAKVDMANVDREALMNVLKERKLRMLSVLDICPNPYNKNKMSEPYFKALLSNLANPQVGFTIPILVRPNPDPSAQAKWMIIDGEHRWKGATQVGYPEIPCICLPTISEGLAKYLMIESNAVHGETKDIDIKNILLSVEELDKDLTASIDIWASTVTEEPIEDDDQYKLDVDDLPDRDSINPVTLYFNDDDLERYKRAVGQYRLAHGCTAEQALLEILDYFEETTGFGTRTGDSILDRKQGDLVHD